MNKHIKVFIVVLLLSLGGFYLFNKYRVAPSIDLNKLSLTNLEGSNFEFASLKGKKTIVCFSASWCPNCINELNALKKIDPNELKDIQIVVIDDETLDVIQAFKERKAYPFTFIKLDANFPEIGIHSIPVTYFFNENLELKKDYVGEIDWADVSMRRHFFEIMDN